MDPRSASLFLMPAALVLAGCATLDPGAPGPSPTPVLPLYAADCSISNWAEPCLALASPNPSPSKTEIDLAVSPKDPLNVIVASKDLDRQASDCVWSVAQVTKDGGKTWKTVYIGGKKSERGPGTPLAGWGCVTDPILAYDKDGWAFYALQAYNAGSEGAAPPAVGGAATSGSAFFLARSKDGGLAWDRIIPLHAGEGNLVFHDYPRMASNPVTGSTFVIWNQFDSASVPGTPVGVTRVFPVLAGTRDRGENAIRPVYLTPADDPNAGTFGINGFAISKAGPRGTMYVTLETEKDNRTSNIWLVVSRDDGETWTRPQKVFEITRITAASGQARAHTPTTTFRIGSSVELAIDASEGPGTGCLSAVWADNRSGNSDILASRSCDEGRQWSPPAQINGDNTTGYQLMPRVAITDDGVTHVSYLTQAYDPGLKLLDAEYAYSEDGGDSWTVRRITAIPSDGDKGVHQDGFPFFGDYDGIGAAGNHVYVGFPHTLTGVAEIAVGHLVRAP